MNGKCSILNIGCGNKDIYYKEYGEYTHGDLNYFKINLDNSFQNGKSSYYAEHEHEYWLERDDSSNITIDVKCDSFEFIKKYKYQFDYILMYRYYEHIPRERLLEFIYLLSTIVSMGGLVDIIVPDYKRLSQLIIDEDPYDINFEKHDILVSTELFNEVYDPHLNITTMDRLKKSFEFEGRFLQYDKWPKYLFDGRDIYFRTIMRRV